MAKYYDIEKGEIGGTDEKSQLLDKILDSVTKQPKDVVLLQAISLLSCFHIPMILRNIEILFSEHF